MHYLSKERKRRKKGKDVLPARAFNSPVTAQLDGKRYYHCHYPFALRISLGTQSKSLPPNRSAPARRAARGEPSQATSAVVIRIYPRPAYRAEFI